MMGGFLVGWTGFVLAGTAPPAPQVSLTLQGTHHFQIPISGMPGALRPAAAPPMELKYEDLPRLLKERGALMKAAALSVKASQLRTEYLEDAGAPQVSVVGGGQGYQTGPLTPALEPYGGLQALMPLYQGGKPEVEAGTRRVQLTLALVEEEQVFRRELATVQDIYWQLIYQRELVRLYGEMDRRNSSVQKAASRRAAKGLVTPTEVVAFAFYGSQLQERMESAQYESLLLERRLADRLGLDGDTTFKVAEAIPHQHGEMFEDKRYDDPALRKLEAQRMLQDYHAQRWIKWSAPSLDLYSSYLLYLSSDRSYGSLRDRLEWAVGVRFSLPLSGGRQYEREAESALTLAQSFEEQIRHERRTFETEIWLHQKGLQQLHQWVVNAEAFDHRMEKIMEETLAEYDRGVRTSQDVLSALERSTAVKVERIERRRDYQLFHVKFEALVGRR